MTEGSPDLLVERDGHVLTVTMNRPEARNAFSPDMLVRAADAWKLLDEDPELRVGILTGAEGCFCSGMDLKALAGGMPDDVQARWSEDPDMHWKALLRHFRPSKPIVAAVEGYCVAGGTEILQATEIRVAGDTAEFAIAEVQRGLFPLGGSTVRLQRQIGFTNAADLLLTGRRISAEEAKAIGLVGHVVPAGQALARARELADLVAANGPLAVKAVLRSMRETAGMTEADGLAHELTIGEPIIFGTKDAKEGPRAFAEKRPPVFTGE
ncbi:crotonase/enoyl-CoA hydratase family protein [Iamia sp. SCSIO 61187]|uniref:crotonase/enoyl-CoA hydratase family protein n=1 Tax=Iamia sp. SCSIO 61187 TaxID=2722752 RepID=UPI001C625873|nr:crotonase/enoyl-CoA hydratase family protein [Iamia sp. SCSIO 61187]QYG94128.1 crotonase/enoyl-CoA hydratase family protein [Iamia sp. SCSIO 61187]